MPHLPDGEYWISGGSSSAVLLWCDMENGGLTVIAGTDVPVKNRLTSSDRRSWLSQLDAASRPKYIDRKGAAVPGAVLTGLQAISSSAFQRIDLPTRGGVIAWRYRTRYERPGPKKRSAAVVSEPEVERQASTP